MKNVRKNTIWSIAEFSVIVFIHFFVMRYIVMRLGVSALGIWAVLISAVQIVRLFDPGAAAGVGRFLSLADTADDMLRVEKILATMFYATVPLYLILSIVFYIPLKYMLGFAMHGDALIQGRALLVFVISSYIAQVVAGTYASALTGLHLGSWKSKISIVGVVLQALLFIALIRKYGLFGLALAQIANYLFVIMASISALKIKIGVSPDKLLRWDWPTFQSVMSFGIGIQFSEMVRVGFEMSIRFIMARFGGVEQVGYYEIAYKIASQARVLAYSVGLPLVPAMTALSVKSKSHLIAFYRIIYARFSFFALLSALGIILVSPLMGLLMLGRIEPVFLFFSILTACGTASYITAIPSGLIAISLGTLRYNITSALVALVSMIVLGFALGNFFSADGVAIAVVLSSLLAALVTILWNSRRLELPDFPDWKSDLQLGYLLDSIRNWKARGSVRAINND